jgi:hypothetical protein
MVPAPAAGAVFANTGALTRQVEFERYRRYRIIPEISFELIFVKGYFVG